MYNNFNRYPLLTLMNTAKDLGGLLEHTLVEGNAANYDVDESIFSQLIEEREVYCEQFMKIHNACFTYFTNIFSVLEFEPPDLNKDMVIKQAFDKLALELGPLLNILDKVTKALNLQSQVPYQFITYTLNKQSQQALRNREVQEVILEVNAFLDDLANNSKQGQDLTIKQMSALLSLSPMLRNIFFPNMLSQLNSDFNPFLELELPDQIVEEDMDGFTTYSSLDGSMISRFPLPSHLLSNTYPSPINFSISSQITKGNVGYAPSQSLLPSLFNSKFAFLLSFLPTSIQYLYCFLFYRKPQKTSTIEYNTEVYDESHDQDKDEDLVGNAGVPGIPGSINPH